MSKLICNINGARGRSIEIYDNKCVIKTDVTLGSIITHNATDGEKTIFYIDITGVQFKESGITLGYLQLETPSMQMNNKDSNFFSENTFTFDNDNEYIRRVYEFIIARIEGYKYGTIDDAPTEISKYSHDKLKQIEKEESFQRQIEEKKQEEEKRLNEMIISIQEGNSVDNNIISFAKQISDCSSVIEILRLWKSIPEELKEPYAIITEKLETSAKTERLYGKDPKSVENLISWIQGMFL